MNRKRASIGKPGATPLAKVPEYDGVLAGIVELLEQARRASARAVNSVMTATYWELGRRIVECEQRGEKRAAYGSELLSRLSRDLGSRFGRGFGVDNLELFRAFYLAYPPEALSCMSAGKAESPIREFPPPANEPRKSESPIRELALPELARCFPLSWTHYVRLMRYTRSPEARLFYEAEALRGGWSVRQLTRQIDSMFYERTALSRNRAAMLTKGAKPKPEDAVTPDDEIRDPLVLEFLGLKDEYSETDLEAALIHHLETFLLELGGDFCFVARQRRLRIDDEWFRVDLVFYHRVLRCLVLIDLKLGRFTHADAGQMHVYLNYAREHWTRPGESPPVGLILCASKGAALARYATEGLPTQMLVREYLTVLPKASLLEAEIARTRRQLEAHRSATRS